MRFFFSFRAAASSFFLPPPSGNSRKGASGASSGETVYAAYVSFTPDENIRLGMTATVSVAQ